MAKEPPIPITIITGFLGSGKTTLILNLIPQLPKNYRLALIKNEFGDVAIDSQLASQQAIAGVRELLNGCICCNLVGSLGDALEELRTTQSPDRIVVETSGSAFPATLAMEVNRIAKDTGHYMLDGVISVIDVENWKGYEDTSVTAKLQAQYTDLIVLNKWESAGERRLDEVVDRILDLDLDVATPRERSDKGWVGAKILLGLDAKLAKSESQLVGRHDENAHDHDHSSEVEVLSVTLESRRPDDSVDMDKLAQLLTSAPRDEVYRIKAIVHVTTALSTSSTDRSVDAATQNSSPGRQILNWAFGRWTFTPIPLGDALGDESSQQGLTQLVRMTVVTARHESTKWRKRIERGELVASALSPKDSVLTVKRIS